MYLYLVVFITSKLPPLLVDLLIQRDQEIEAYQLES